MIAFSPLSTQQSSTRLSQRTCFLLQSTAATSVDLIQPTNNLHIPNYSHHGLLSALPRSPTPAPTSASLVRCQLPTTLKTPPTTTAAVTTHNACRQLPSLPRSSPDQASSTSSQMRASPWQSPKPLNLVYRGQSRTHDPTTITDSLINHLAALLLISKYGVHMYELETSWLLRALVEDHHDIDFARAWRAYQP